MKKELTFLFLIMILSISSISALGNNFIFSTSSGNINLSTSLLSGTKLNWSDLLNVPAGFTDTTKGTSGDYLYNDSTTIYFNESKLNATIDLRVVSVSDTNIINDSLYNSSQFEENTDGNLGINLTWFSNLFDTLFGNKDTDDLPEGSTNLYDNKSWNESLADSKYATIGAGADNESWNESYADNLYVNVDGDTMTGPLEVRQNLTLEDNGAGEVRLIFEDGSETAPIFSAQSGAIGFVYQSSFSIISDTAIDGDMNATGVVCDGSGNCLNSVGGSDVNKTYVDAQDSAQDECSEITGCVENAVTNATMNKTVDWNDIIGIPEGFDDDIDNVSSGDTDAGYYNSSRINTTQFEDASGELHLLDSWINTLIDNRVTQAFVSALGFFTKTEIESFGYYNSSDFDIANYYNTTQTDTEIINANTSMKNYVDGEIADIEAGDNESWNQSFAETLFAGIEWDYNQTTASVNILNGTGLIKDWNNTGLIINWSNEISFTDTDSNLTEDDVEGYIFDDDNTANLGMNGYNVTNATYMTFCNGANCWKMHVNSSDYFIIEEI